MNMRRIAKQDSTSEAETLGDAMMHAVGRESVDAFDADPHMFDGAAADSIKGQRLMVMVRLPMSGTYQAEALPRPVREDGREVTVGDIGGPLAATSTT